MESNQENRLYVPILYPQATWTIPSLVLLPVEKAVSISFCIYHSHGGSQKIFLRVLRWLWQQIKWRSERPGIVQILVVKHWSVKSMTLVRCQAWTLDYTLLNTWTLNYILGHSVGSMPFKQFKISKHIFIPSGDVIPGLIKRENQPKSLGCLHLISVSIIRSFPLKKS